MLAFCCEMEGGLCVDFRNRNQENRPSLQYALHLLSRVMPVGFSDVAGFCGRGGAMQDLLLVMDPEEVQENPLQRPLCINPAAFYFLLTGMLLQEDWFTFHPAGEEENLPDGEELFPLHEQEYGALCRYLKMEEPLRVLLYGGRGSGCHTLIRRACGKAGMDVLFLRIKSMMGLSKSAGSRIRQALRLIVRLMAPVVALELADELSGANAEEWENMRGRLFQDLGGSRLCMLARTQVQLDLVKEETDVRIFLKEALSREEKRQALAAWVPPEDRRQWQEDLLDHYRLNIGQWKKRRERIAVLAGTGAFSLAHREAWLEVMQERQAAFRFGRLVEAGYGPEDIILPADCRRQLETVVRLAKAWRGQKGFQVLFHGSSGTGKTMAAAVIAGQLQLPLLKVDLSRIFDKYIGETEKHLDEIFQTAQRNHYLLFFDEADAVFAKRTAVRDSHDRYANVSASFLLQRMEEYDGILILSTNLKDHFDDAFVRRIRFVVKFRNLDREGRERLWRKALEGNPAPASDVDYQALADAVELSPARISAAACVAKLLAVCDGGSAVSRDHLWEALALEAGKDETAVRRF